MEDMGDDQCELCGGELEEREISDEREAQLRENIPDLDGKTLHATVCTECGHVAYRKQE